MKAMLDVDNLVVEFDTYDGRVCVLQQLSFSLRPNETLCIVGERPAAARACRRSLSLALCRSRTVMSQAAGYCSAERT